MTPAVVRICFVLCALARYSRCLEDPADGSLIGESCKRDYQCSEHAYCYYQRTCRCEEDYLSTLDKRICLPTVGMKCKDDLACGRMENAECKQGLCACKDTFFLNSTNSSSCFARPVHIGGRCQVHALCQDTFGFALCVNEKCQCYAGHHFTNETKTCIQSRGLYYSCANDYECYMDDESPDILECKNGQCVCKEGEPRCSKGSLIAATGTLVTISLLLRRAA